MAFTSRAHHKQLTVLTPHPLSGGAYRPITIMSMGEAEMSQVSGSGGVQVIERPRRVAATQWYDRSPFQLTLNFVMDIGITSVSYTHLRAHETGRNLVC